MQKQASEQEYAEKSVTAEKLARYADLKSSAKTLYDTFGSVRCPALKNEEVHFTGEGFNHLVYRIAKQERHRSVQIMRFELLEKAKELLGKTTTIQEYEEHVDQVKGWMQKKPHLANVTVKDIGFVGIIRGFRIKVVVRKIGNGKLRFLSVIPAWSTQYYRDIKLVRNTKGNVAD